MTFDATYRDELAFLREMGREIALEHPGLCDTLAEPGRDPDVERLLEGFAFVAARTRERADDAIPEAIDAIAEMIAPHAMRPVPASTVVELTPRGSIVRDRVHVAAGAAFGGRPIDGTRCELRSTSGVDLLPLVVERAVLDRSRARAPRLVVSLRTPRASLDLVHGARPIRFFVHAPLGVASTLMLAIDRHLQRVCVRIGDRETATGLSVRPIDPDVEPHLPWPERSPEAAHHLIELAYFPERHLFFDVVGLDRVPSEARAERFDVCIELAEGAPLPDALAEDALRLHCVPAINLFPCDAEPISWRDDLRDVPLRGAGIPPSAIEVFDVRSVVGLAEGSRRRTYRSFVGFDHLAAPGATGFYALRRCVNARDGAVDTFMRVGARATSGPETLSTELRCTNRLLVTKLRTGDVCEPIAGSPAVATFTNLSPLGPRASCPTGSAALYALVGASGTGRRTRLSSNAIAGWLATCAVPAASDVARSRVCGSLARSISEVREKPFRAARRGLIERGLSIEIDVDEALVPSVGEAYLLTRALDRALACELPLNVQQQLTAVLSPSRTRVTMPTRAAPE